MDNTAGTMVLGIDIGGTNTKFGFVNRQGEILAKSVLSTDQFATVQQFAEEVYRRAGLLQAEAGLQHRLLGIGIGAPNANFHTGTVEQAPNLPWKGVVPLAKAFEEQFHLPCTITNDANAAALGEQLYGCARGMTDIIMITLGTGVGSGIISAGTLLYGHDGFAGELGHTIIRPGGRKHWSTGSEGSLEAYASATGIAITAKEMRAEHPDSLLNDVPEEKLDARLVFDCAEKGDPVAKEVFRFTGQILGESLANFVMFSSPQAIILFGGAARAGEYLLGPVREHMEKNLFPVFRNKVKILLSALSEADAAILGASALAWQKN